MVHDKRRQLEMSTKTKIKFCGLTRPEDIETVNELRPEYVGFVFWTRSKRNVTRQKALELRKALLPGIKAVGVFVDEEPEAVAELLSDGVIDIAQLHGNEDEKYIERLRELVRKEKIAASEDGVSEAVTESAKRIDECCAIIKAIVINSEDDIDMAKHCSADYLLLDSGKGTGATFNWELIKNAKFGKPFFLAGGLDPENVTGALKVLSPYAVDVSSGIETDGVKDPEKMRIFADRVRKEEKL